MQKVNKISNTLYKRKVTKKYAVKLKKLGDGEKISILSDIMFKAMFQTVGREKYASKLMSYYTDYSYEELLNNLVLQKNELDKSVANKKGLRCDFVGSIDGVKLNIEINNNSSVETMERNLEYAFRLYSSDVNKDIDYEYATIIQFNINNFAFEGNDKTIDIFTIQNEEGEKLTDKLIIVHIYIPNLRKKWYNNGVESLNEGEKFLLTLVETNIRDSIEIGKGIDIMEEYIKDAIKASGDEMLLEAYDKEWALKDEGMREGYESGKNDGIEENKIEIVRNMLKENLDINLISKITGLSIDRINEIKNENL